MGHLINEVVSKKNCSYWASGLLVFFASFNLLAQNLSPAPWPAGTGAEEVQNSWPAVHLDKTPLNKLKGKLHTVLLLGALASSHKIQKALEQYERSGQQVDYDFLTEEIESILRESITSTAQSTALWMQIAGSGLVDEALQFSHNGFEKAKQFMGPSLETTQELKLRNWNLSRLLTKQLLGYVGFYGWEFGGEVHNSIVSQLRAKELKQHGPNLIKLIDAQRAESIVEILTDRTLAMDYLEAGFEVLGESEKLQNMLKEAYRRWTTFDLLGTFVALQVGGSVGQMVGRGVGGFLGGRLGLSGAQMGATIGGAVASFAGVILATLAKEGPIIKDRLDALDGWIIEEKTQKFAEQALTMAYAFYEKAQKGEWPQASEILFQQVERQRAIDLDLRRLVLILRPYFEEMMDYLNVNEFEKATLVAFMNQEDSVFQFLFPQIRKLAQYHLVVETLKKSPRDWQKTLVLLPEYQLYQNLRNDMSYERMLALYESEFTALLCEYPLLNIKVEWLGENVALWKILIRPSGYDVKWAQRLLYPEERVTQNPPLELMETTPTHIRRKEKMRWKNQWVYPQVDFMIPRSLNEFWAQKVLQTWNVHQKWGGISSLQEKKNALARAAQIRFQYVNSFDLHELTLESLFGVRRDLPPEEISRRQRAQEQFVRIRQLLLEFLALNRRALELTLSSLNERSVRYPQGVKEHLYRSLDSLQRTQKALYFLLHVAERPRGLVSSHLSFVLKTVAREFQEDLFGQQFAEFQHIQEQAMLRLLEEERLKLMAQIVGDYAQQLRRRGYSEEWILRQTTLGLTKRAFGQFKKQHHLWEQVQRLEGRALLEMNWESKGQ